MRAEIVAILSAMGWAGDSVLVRLGLRQSNIFAAMLVSYVVSVTCIWTYLYYDTPGFSPFAGDDLFFDQRLPSTTFCARSILRSSDSDGGFTGRPIAGCRAVVCCGHRGSRSP